MQPPKKVSKRKGQLDEITRENAKRVRKSGACLRCRMLKMQCDGNHPCMRCKTVKASVTIWVMPCFRGALAKIIPFRAGNSRANQEVSELPKLLWDSDDLNARTIRIRYPFNSAVGTILELSISVRRFKPNEGRDVLKDVWEGENGERHEPEFQPFACYNDEATADLLKKYIYECDTLLEMDLTAIDNDEISRTTIDEAIRFASIHPNSCVRQAQQIRRIAYFCTKSMTIVGDETLGGVTLNDSKLPTHGQIPVPSVLDFQLDTIAITIMFNLLKKVEEGLKKKFNSKTSKEHWYEIYLVCFLLLSTLERVTQFQLSYLSLFEDKKDEDMLRW
ncbi:hypothetical protein DL98DRAFT_236546 [Cadophora sp. DSE1049]|nr:hypothetical protein DL98DRAFT_236546 [Cadophora sp. DSE1049]